MAIKKKAQVQGPRVWTVAELGAFYTEHRSELLAHANRVLKDSAKAEEITQDALIKFMFTIFFPDRLLTFIFLPIILQISSLEIRFFSIFIFIFKPINAMDI